MTNQLSILNYQNHSIHSLIKNGEIYFRATQLAEILEYTNPHDAIKNHVDKDDLAKIEVIDSLGRKQKANFVNESGMYALILGSKKEEAKKVKKWVTSKILPTIRKTGSYSLTINTEQKYQIKKAVNERVHRTGEKHQAIYHKFYDYFKINSYEALPVSKFNEAIDFLGGVHVRHGLSDEDWYDLAWLYKAADRMRYQIELIVPALNALGASCHGAFYSMAQDYKYVLKCARPILERETAQINDKGLTNKWNNVLSVIRGKPRTKAINFESDIHYLE